MTRFRAKEIINRWPVLERKKLSIDEHCHNKQARYTCIPRSLNVSDNMIRFKAKEIINRRILPQQTSQIVRKKLSIVDYCHNKHTLNTMQAVRS